MLNKDLAVVAQQFLLARDAFGQAPGGWVSAAKGIFGFRLRRQPLDSSYREAQVLRILGSPKAACDKITRESAVNDELRREIAAVRELIYAD